MVKRRDQANCSLKGWRGLVMFGVLMCCGALAVQARQTSHFDSPSQASAPVTPTGEAGTTQTLHLLVGHSLIITSPTRIKRVSLADPTIAEAIVVSPYQVVLNGKAPGVVSFLVWDEKEQSQIFEVTVELDLLDLNRKLEEAFPSEHVDLTMSGNVAALSGKVSSPDAAKTILDFVKGAVPKVTSALQVPVPPTANILLEVKFAEVDRTALSQLGVNILSFPGNKIIGSTSTQQFAPPQLQNIQNTTTTGNATTQSTAAQFSLSDLLNVFLFRPDINLAATIKALQARDLLQILAEPNLLTASGKDASFLAGGEFPYPVVQGVTGGGTGAVTIQFKEFGIRLNFTPTLEADGNIHLKVQPEVSSLDFANAVTLQGFTIPALSTRRVESEMDLKDGQSFAIAGLVDNRVTEQLEKIPGIGDVPILGKLFQSRILNKSRNELLVVVTPRLAPPLNQDQKPAGPTFPSSFLEPPKGEHTTTPANK
jgi:pilus assembly protein CpaC